MTATFFQVEFTGLPIWAQIFLAILAAVTTFFTFRHSLAIKEFNILTQRCERLQTEVREKVEEIGQLKERTDLQPLVAAFKDMQDSFKGWQTEARSNFSNAMGRLEQIRTENVNAVTAATDILFQIAERLGEKHGN